jgi:hypothetical protein
MLIYLISGFVGILGGCWILLVFERIVGVAGIGT